MTLLVEPLRNLPFIQGLPHGSSLWMAGQASPPSGCSGAPLDQTNSPFTATKPHSHGGDSAWWVNPLLKIKHLGLNNPHGNSRKFLSFWAVGFKDGSITSYIRKKQTKTNGTLVRPQKEVSMWRCGTPCSHFSYKDFMGLPFCTGDGHKLHNTAETEAVLDMFLTSVKLH